MSFSPPSSRIPVAVLGATGTVGQRFVQLLEAHPWFELGAVAASERSAGRAYGEACRWKVSARPPAAAAAMRVVACDPAAEGMSRCRVVFSALDSSVAGPAEEAFAAAGFAVFSNARNHRTDEDVPVVVPGANGDHLVPMARAQERFAAGGGFIVCNSNCASAGLVVPLKALQAAFGVRRALVFTMQAVSGAGYPGVPSLDVVDNVVPYIGGEEEKLETEPRKILGRAVPGERRIEPADVRVSAHCNRVPVLDGHTECVSVELGRDGVTPAEAEAVLRAHTSLPQRLGLPSAPPAPVVVLDAPDRPQPRLDRGEGDGYAVTVGRVRECPLFGVKFTLCSHNTVLGAAGGSILNAELAVAQGLVK